MQSKSGEGRPQHFTLVRTKQRDDFGIGHWKELGGWHHATAALPQTKQS